MIPMRTARTMPHRVASNSVALLQDFDNLFQGLLGAPYRQAPDSKTTRHPAWAAGLQDRVFPLVNVWEESDGYRVEAELPGVSADKLDATVEGKELVLKGERSAGTEVENQQTRRRETSYGVFERKIRFPVELDSEKVDASLKNGVLTLKIAKAVSAQRKKIEVVTH